MSDQLTTAYAEYLEGSYDCADRIVLNAYFGMGHTGGGMRAWWRRLYGHDDNLDKEHLMRLGGRLGRRVKAYAEKTGLPLVYCKAGVRKQEIAQQYKPADESFRGLFLIISSRASGMVWDVRRTADGRIQNIECKYQYIKHYFFHIIDPDWGHVVIRMSGHPPWSCQIILNGHEYVARQAAKDGLQFAQDGNCFTNIIGDTIQLSATETSCDAQAHDAKGLAEMAGQQPHLAQYAETFCSESIIGQLRQVCERWIYSACLSFALSTDEQETSGFRYQYSVFQMEFSRNWLFKRPRQLNQVFDTLIERARSRLDIKRLKTIFGRRKRPAFCKKAQREEVVLSMPSHDLTIFKLHFGSLTVKLYSKGEHVLRCEAIVHNTKPLAWKRSLPRFPEILQRLNTVLSRFLDQLHCLDAAFIADETLDSLPQHSTVGKSHVAGFDLNKPRIRAVLEAVVSLAPLPNGFSAAQLAAKVRELLQLPDDQYLPRHAAYDLKKLRGKQWVHKVGKSRRYQPDSLGLKTMAALITLRDKIIQPILAGAGRPKVGRPPKSRSDLDLQYFKVQTDMLDLFQLLGIQV